MRLIKFVKLGAFWTLVLVWLAFLACFVLTNWWTFLIGSKNVALAFQYHAAWLASDPTPSSSEWLVTRWERISGRGEIGWWPRFSRPPWGGISLVLPLWLPVTILGVAVTAWTGLALRSRRRIRGACPKCHYDRRGLPAGAKCPECGAD